MRAFDLNTPRALAAARILVPLLFGMYSLWLGADSNWDLCNYHIYNAFAWLHDKLEIDLAPAGLQSYFNPLLDVFFYLANTHLPGWLVGFLMGALHGLSFVFLLGIAQRVLPDLPEQHRYRAPLLLALAGCLTANFLSGLGNSMGDDSTAPFSLAGLLVLVSNWPRLGRWAGDGIAVALLGGFIVGLGTGLKLTNAVFAIAMCVALLSYPGQAVVRLRIAFLFGLGVLVGFALTGGYWMIHMWKLFGNPLYPQFSAFFPNPLVQPGGKGDPRWGPHGWFEITFWPFIFTLNSKRVGEIPIRQVIWLVAYVLFWLWVVSGAERLISRRKATATMDQRARMVVLFVAVGYVVWMELFSIYRYLVAIEMLTPLVVWILVHRLLPDRAARRTTGWILAVTTAVVLFGGNRSWGHEGWADPVWHAEVPPIAQPDRTTVVIAMTRGRAWAWLATFFPDSVSFMQIESNFPGTPAFGDRMREVAKERGGPSYAIIDAEYNGRVDNIATANMIVNLLGLTGNKGGCNALQWAVTKLRLHASVVPSDTGDGRECKLTLRADDLRDIPAENRSEIERAVPMFERNGFVLDPASCKPYRSSIGQGVLMYQWCRVKLRDAR